MIRDIDRSHVHVGSSIPGRVRLHLRKAAADEPCAISDLLAEAPGIRDVQVTMLTGSVLVHYDVTQTTEAAILVRLSGGAHVGPCPAGSAALPDLDRPGRHHDHNRQRRATATWDRAGAVDQAAIMIAPRVGAAEAPPRDAVDLLIKGTSVILGLLLADSPLGVILGGLDVLCLIADIASAGRRSTRGGIPRLPSLMP